MSLLRSILFAIYFYGGTVVICTLYTPLAFLPGWIGRPFFRFWVDYSAFGARVLLGIRWRIVFPDGSPATLERDGPVVIASKHQSAWETIVFNQILTRPAFVLKRELLSIPLFGRYLLKCGHIAIDRSAGSSALKMMVAQAEQALAAGRSIVIYPQGTRVSPGASEPYRPGTAALYRQLGRPVIPVALNSGRLWGRNAFWKRPGLVTICILPEIEPGLDRKTFMRTLEDRIETACRSLDTLPAEEIAPVDRIVE